MTTQEGNQQQKFSALSPLRQQLFRALWIASLASNIGTWIHEVGEAWLLTSLTTSPTLIGLLETAITLPIFLLALPGGALADIVDRRRMLIIAQSWMLVIAAVMGLCTFTGVMTPGLLLTMTFALSIGVAVSGPAWQASIPELVSREDLPSAIALGSVAFNVARAVGPAIGGLIIAASGVWVAFVLNAVSFLGVIIVLYRWKREHKESVLPTERVLGAIRAGIRFARHAPALQAVLIRTGVFILCASALWATLPFIARHEMGLSSLQYGLLLGAFGSGAVAGAVIMAKIRKRITVDMLVRIATIMFVALLSTLAFVRIYTVIAIAMTIGGIAWMIMMSSLNIAAQIASPAWVRARAMSMYILVFMGGFAIGSALWGFVAAHVGVTASLGMASAGAILGIVLTKRYKLMTDETIDLTPSMHWPEPTIAIEPRPEQGPVMITVEYHVSPDDAHEFSKAMHALGRIRRRDGAVQWGIFKDIAHHDRYLETYVVESWAEHLRQHERVTVADRDVEERVNSFHAGPKKPAISHFIYSDSHG